MPINCCLQAFSNISSSSVCSVSLETATDFTWDNGIMSAEHIGTSAETFFSWRLKLKHPWKYRQVLKLSRKTELPWNDSLVFMYLYCTHYIGLNTSIQQHKDKSVYLHFFYVTTSIQSEALFIFKTERLSQFTLRQLQEQSRTNALAIKPSTGQSLHPLRRVLTFQQSLCNLRGQIIKDKIPDLHPHYN